MHEQSTGEVQFERRTAKQATVNETEGLGRALKRRSRYTLIKNEAKGNLTSLTQTTSGKKGSLDGKRQNKENEKG